MTAVNHPQEDHKLVRILKAAHALDLGEAPRHHPERTERCPTLPRLAAGRSQSWTAEEKQHILVEQCGYCQKMLALFARAESQSAKPTTHSADAGHIPTRIDEATSPQTGLTGITALIHAGQLDAVANRLRPYQEDLLALAGLPPTQAEALWQFLTERLKTVPLGGRRFGDLLPEWLTEFAQAQGAPRRRPLTRADWEAALEARSVRIVLESAPPEEPEWSREFRRLALSREVLYGQDLLRIQLPKAYGQVEAFQRFRRDLLSKIYEERGAAIEALS